MNESTPVGCAYAYVDCGLSEDAECPFSVCYRDDKRTVRLEIRNDTIWWMHHEKRLKNRIIAWQTSLSISQIKKIIRRMKDERGLA